MKPLYIIVAVILIVGGAMLFLGGGDEMQDTTNTTETTSPTNDNADDIEEMDSMDDMDAESDEDNDTTGSDEGMEFPTVDAGTGEVKVFTVDSFGFGYSLDEIRVNEGDTVTINLTNSGGMHDWVVDEFDAATARISEGGTATVTFVADKAGTYEFYCSVGNHRERGMVGTLIVE